MNNTKICPKCQHPMNLGFIAPRSVESSDITRWVEGEPERSFWKSLKVPPEKIFPVTTYRCVSCGFLEAYALR
jgi:hypothetical protein